MCQIDSARWSSGRKSDCRAAGRGFDSQQISFLFLLPSFCWRFLVLPRGMWLPPWPVWDVRCGCSHPGGHPDRTGQSMYFGAACGGQQPCSSPQGPGGHKRSQECHKNASGTPGVDFDFIFGLWLYIFQLVGVPKPKQTLISKIAVFWWLGHP